MRDRESKFLLVTESKGGEVNFNFKKLIFIKKQTFHI